ncbi:MAG: hypothetical protein DMF29_10480 [Verrucomicrobia bacterium]|nr:MAG: hypothetical protein DMF29_10480 [Verrucomicrobiota bacterium]
MWIDHRVVEAAVSAATKQSKTGDTPAATSKFRDLMSQKCDVFVTRCMLALLLASSFQNQTSNNM